jgi:histidinol-phosphatase
MSSAPEEPTGRELVEVAMSAAQAGATVAMSHFGRTGTPSRKADGSIVTDADLRAEAAIVERLARLAPGEPVLGEEGGLRRTGAARRTWFVDPIDGTENFSRGIPMWATLVACVDGDRPVAAAVVAPALHRRWWAGRGTGTFDEAGRLHVSALTDRAAATMAFGGIHEYPPWAWTALSAVAGGFRTAWGWGNFLGHVLVGEGVVDVALSYGTSPWDVAAVALVVEEAGGRWSSVTGDRRLTAGSLLTSNGRLHDELVADLVGAGLGAPTRE